MDISVIILNYKSKGLTLNCVRSIRESDFKKSPQLLLRQSYGGQAPLSLAEAGQARGVIKYEIIVVDNNSGDSIGEILNWQYPEVKFIQNERNIGMGAGNNVGIKRAKGKYVVIANPDILVSRNALRKMYDFMEENKDVGVAGPRQFNPDRTVQDSCYRWHGLFTPVYRRTPLGKFKFAKKDLDRFLMKDVDLSMSNIREDINDKNPSNPSLIKGGVISNPPSPLAPRLPRCGGGRGGGYQGGAMEVDWLLGSFLFCRAEALRQVGMFDERFFLYFEDTDLCRRFWQKNWKVVYFPEAEVIHNHTRSSAQEPWYKFLVSAPARSHIASWIKYLKKWGIGK